MSKSTAWDRFSQSIPADEQDQALALIRTATLVLDTHGVVISDLSARDHRTRRAAGYLRWSGREHRFIVEVLGENATTLLAWNDATPFEPYEDMHSTIAPGPLLIADARSSNRRDVLLEQWDALMARQDVQTLLRRHAFDAHAAPESDRTGLWRDRIEAIGFRFCGTREAIEARRALMPPVPVLVFRRSGHQD